MADPGRKGIAMSGVDSISKLAEEEAKYRRSTFTITDRKSNMHSSVIAAFHLF